MASVFIRGARCVYEVTGEGPALVLIHSIGLSSREGWRAQLPVLAETRRVLSYDIRGLGDSAAGDGPLGVADFAEDLAALMDHVEMPRAALMGVSLGGFIAQAFAGLYPGRVSALVLVSTACRIAAGNSGERAARNARIRDHGMAVAANRQLDSHFSEDFRAANPEVMAWYRAHYCANDPDTYIAIMEDLGRFDNCANLAGISCLTLVVAGAEDVGAVAGVTPCESARMLQAGIPGARLEIITGAHHYPQIERPDAFNAAVTGFLAQCGG